MIPILIFIIASIVFAVLRLPKPKSAPPRRFEYTPEIEIPTILTVQEFVTKYKSKNGKVKGGTLCFWGHWFGRPYDNYHQIVRVEFHEAENKLEIHFSESELLTIDNPGDIEEYKTKIKICSAKRIFWEWHLYGSPHIPENYAYVDITKTGDKLEGQTNFMSNEKTFANLNINEPSVLLT